MIQQSSESLIQQPTSQAGEEDRSEEPANAAPPIRADDLRFESLSVDQGLSESVVNAVLEDHLGFMWFGTQNGLNKYDGYGFIHFYYDPSDPKSLSQSFITALCEDQSGNLWVGTLNRGVNRYDRDENTFTHLLHDAKDPNSLASDRITVLSEDHSGILWIGTNNAGLDRFNPQTGEFTHFRHDPNDPTSLSDDAVLAVFQDQSGQLWIGTATGLDHFDEMSGKFTRIFSGPINQRIYGVQTILEDSQGMLWIGTSNAGLYQFDRASGVMVHYLSSPTNPNSLSNNRVQAILEDRAGVIWIGTHGGGLSRLDPQTRQFMTYRHDTLDQYSLGDDRIFSLVEDHSGILWIGTYGSGINKLDPGYKQFVHYHHNPQEPDSLKPGMVFAISAAPDGVVWIGTFDNGLNRMDPESKKFTHFLNRPADERSLSNNSIRALYLGEDGTLWIGTGEGLNSLANGSSDFIRYVDGRNEMRESSYSMISAIAEDQDGILWIGTEGNGLLAFSPHEKTYVQHFINQPEDANSLIFDTITTVFIDSQNQIWVGTPSGLEKLDPSSGDFTHFQTQPGDLSSLSDNYVMSIFEDSRGKLWIGTMSGINLFDSATGTFHQYHTKDGLPNEYIYAILEDDQGFLWISTNLGLSRFDPRSETFRNYDVHDGLQSNEFNIGAAFRSPGGQLFFGGINGVTAFYPENIRENPFQPPVVLTSISQHGNQLMSPAAAEGLQSLMIRWPDNLFEFEFTALSYSRPERNQFAYYLEGFDEDWNYIGTRHNGQYTNLPGKTYTLHIKGANDDGVWNATGIAIQIKVVPPFWGTWWFRIGAAGLALVSVAGGYRLRIKNIQTRNAELERQVNERTREIERLFEQTKELAVIEERNRLARDLHDSAKQKAFAALAQLGATRGILRYDASAAATHLEEAENLVYEVIQELTFLIQEMYPLALKEKGLVTALREYIYEWENRTDIQADLRVEGGQPLPLQTEQAIYRIVQESLANVSRHSKAERVEIAVCYTPDAIQVSIMDNGQGFDVNQKPTGVGLQSMRERAAMIGGEINVDAFPGKGTRVTIQAPLRSELPEPTMEST